MNDISATLAERGGRYGSFAIQAEIEQDLMARLAREPGWARLAADQKSALQMVCVKAARIVNGDPNYPDNWHDIIGYARLIDDRLAQGMLPDRAINEDLSVPKDQQARPEGCAQRPSPTEWR